MVGMLDSISPSCKGYLPCRLCKIWKLLLELFISYHIQLSCTLRLHPRLETKTTCLNKSWRRSTCHQPKGGGTSSIDDLVIQPTRGTTTTPALHPPPPHYLA
jgi:hypothetical protein